MFGHAFVSFQICSLHSTHLFHGTEIPKRSSRVAQLVLVFVFFVSAADASGPLYSSRCSEGTGSWIDETTQFHRVFSSSQYLRWIFLPVFVYIYASNKLLNQLGFVDSEKCHDPSMNVRHCIVKHERATSAWRLEVTICFRWIKRNKRNSANLFREPKRSYTIELPLDQQFMDCNRWANIQWLLKCKRNAHYVTVLLS